MKIPIVDLADLGLGNKSSEVSSETEQRVARELHTALSTVGFVYLKRHGIDDRLVSKIFDVTSHFFGLPVQVKSGYNRPLDNNGYVAPGREILEDTNRHEIREAYDVTNIDGIFPDREVPEMRQAILNLFNEACELTERLLTVLALALGLERDYFSSRHLNMGQGVSKNATTFRTLYYPSLADSEVEAGVERCGKHSDYGTLTLLFQDDMGGLEVLSEGNWVPATPIPGTILVNVGDLMQFWTADKYLATVHRVRVPEEEIRRRSARQSIAFFVHPDNEVMVSPLDGSDKRPPVSAIGHLQERYSHTYKY